MSGNVPIMEVIALSPAQSALLGFIADLGGKQL